MNKSPSLRRRERRRLEFFILIFDNMTRRHTTSQEIQGTSRHRFESKQNLCCTEVGINLLFKNARSQSITTLNQHYHFPSRAARAPQSAGNLLGYLHHFAHPRAEAHRGGTLPQSSTRPPHQEARRTLGPREPRCGLPTAKWMPCYCY